MDQDLRRALRRAVFIALAAALAPRATAADAPGVPRVGLPADIAPALTPASPAVATPDTLTAPAAIVLPPEPPALITPAAAPDVRVPSAANAGTPKARTPTSAAAIRASPENTAPPRKSATEGGEETFGGLVDQSLSVDQLGATVGKADILGSHRPTFTESQTRRIQEIDHEITRAVREAVAAVHAMRDSADMVVSRGSTSRGTYATAKPDNDINVPLPQIDSFEELMAGHADQFRDALSASAGRSAARLFPGRDAYVSVGKPVRLTNPATRQKDSGVALFHLNVHDTDGGGRLIKADVTLTNSRRYANSYPDYFADQLDQIARRDGAAAVQGILSDIRLAKLYFKSRGALKPHDGGPSAVGVEQMIMQSGLVLDSDLGRTILETGSFDRMMARIFAAAYDHSGRLRTFYDFQRAWTVHNAFMEPANFLALLRPTWKQLASAARTYQEALLAGRPITFDDLARRRTNHAPPSQAEDVGPTQTPSAAATIPAKGAYDDKDEGRRYAQGERTLPSELDAAWTGRATQPVPSGPGIHTARALLLRRGGGAYVMLPSHDKEGPGNLRSMEVDDMLVQGIVSDTLVAIAYDDDDYILGLRPIGSYRQDMMVGRVVKHGGELRLEGLFRQEDGRPSSLYTRLKLRGGIRVEKEMIVHAFIRPMKPGYEAVPLIDLGRAITPEIASREIALRSGARGYFDEPSIRQVEEVRHASNPAGDFESLARASRHDGQRARFEDLRALPFVTIDPPGTADMDDAYHIVRQQDGSYTWTLATADVAHYVRPGTPAFRAAARAGNTIYSIDGNYPMNHPVVSHNLASLIDGKDRLAVITRMRFDADGNFLRDQSEVFLGLVHVRGRYTYEQVARLWREGSGHGGVEHADQVSLARELAGKLSVLDAGRGEMRLSLDLAGNSRNEAGVWSRRRTVEDPLLSEAHHLIGALKVYGNRVLAARLDALSREYGIPHISRIHPEQTDTALQRLKRGLREIGAPWKDGSLSGYLAGLRWSGLSPEQIQVAQWLALTSRPSARYAVEDDQGHAGLALRAGEYDHPSAPIRRFADMYNLALLEAELRGEDPRNIHATMLADLRSLGFESLEDYMSHLNGREQAARRMGREIDEFVSLNELGSPENAGRTFHGYVRLTYQGRNPSTTIQLEGTAATVVLNGQEAEGYRLLERVEVTVRGVDLAARRLHADIRRRRPRR